MINTLNNLITTYRDCHNHQANNDKIAVDKFLSNLKDLVKTDHRPIPTIYQEDLTRVGQEEFAQHIPLYHSADSSLYRSRAKTLPVLPKLRTNINLPEEYQKTTSGEDFVLLSADDNKFMIFATLDNLRHLAAAGTYLCDGTFSTCPSLFYQMYTIHASVHNKIVPLVYALLPDKKQSTYMQLFTILKQKATERDINLNPDTIITDFEVAAQNAASSVFECNLKGCMFHFRQAVWKGAQKAGLQVAFEENPMVAQVVRRAAALPLVRPTDIDDFWLNALEEADLDYPGVLRFNDYVTDQWVEGGNRSVWNHFETAGPRTTNNVEGWHSKVNKLVTSHPNIYRFINLKQEQAFCEVTLKQLAAGASLKPRKWKYRQLEERLVTEKWRLHEGHYTVVEYGDAVSHLVGL